MPTLAAGSRLLAEDLLANTAPVDTMLSAWITWSPTLTALTLGSGSVSAKYKQNGKTVHYRFKFTYGAGSAVGSSPKFTLPAAPHADYANMPLGDIDLTDAGTANRRGMARLVSGSTVEVVSYGTTGIATTTTSTVPHTWASGDTISVVGTYETT